VDLQFGGRVGGTVFVLCLSCFGLGFVMTTAAAKNPKFINIEFPLAGKAWPSLRIHRALLIVGGNRVTSLKSAASCARRPPLAGEMAAEKSKYGFHHAALVKLGAIMRGGAGTT